LLHEFTSAEFLGTADDEAENNANKDKCTKSVTEKGSAKILQKPLPENGWTDDIRVFFPTDVKRPYETMIEVSGAIGISGKSDGYVSFFNYIANRLPGRTAGDVDAVVVSPVFPDTGGYFSSAFAQEHQKAPTLGPKGEIGFHIFGKPYDNWRAVRAYYRFEALDGTVLAQIPLPLFQEVGR